MRASQIVVLAAVVLVVVLGYEAEVSMAAAAVTCNPEQLNSCVQRISFGTLPSADNPPSAVIGVRETQDRFKRDREGTLSRDRRLLRSGDYEIHNRSPPVNN
ncbi:hypothetical protein RHSIM_RhsimUnG0075800 [Rhododendron simsii]|uniref:Uncharacterized protein n=1 Tax=Rhododendron simsii TaxID=118357 RepID=A0A834L585_RHOSS|nr:hypothetical protein RHSIM_RhsimUnG0075800 [Rhododendron simsii]